MQADRPPLTELKTKKMVGQLISGSKVAEEIYKKADLLAYSSALILSWSRNGVRPPGVTLNRPGVRPGVPAPAAEPEIPQQRLGAKEYFA